MRVLQYNVGRSLTRLADAIDRVNPAQPDVLLVQEPPNLITFSLEEWTVAYTPVGDEEAGLLRPFTGAAIVAKHKPGRTIQQLPHVSIYAVGFRISETANGLSRSWLFVSVYLPPHPSSEQVNSLNRSLDAMVSAVQEPASQLHIVIGGDFNIGAGPWSPANYRTCQEREQSDLVTSWMDSMALGCITPPDIGTNERPQSHHPSTIDISFASTPPTTFKRVEGGLRTDHWPLFFAFRTQDDAPVPSTPFSAAKVDWSLFSREIEAAFDPHR